MIKINISMFNLMLFQVSFFLNLDRNILNAKSYTCSSFLSEHNKFNTMPFVIIKFKKLMIKINKV
jgi:hypothetical protein